MVAFARGDVVRVRLDPTQGSEMRKTRPCVVVQRDAANRAGRTTIVCPLTDAQGKKPNPIRILVPAGSGGASKDRLALCSQIRVIDVSRIVAHLGTLPAGVMAGIERGLRTVLDLA